MDSDHLACRFGRFELRPERRQLLVDGQPAKLGTRAFDVLLALMERRDRTVSKNELLDTVWPSLVVEENNLQVQISSLRKLLGQTVIATIPGRGYRLLQRSMTFLQKPWKSYRRHAVRGEATCPNRCHGCMVAKMRCLDSSRYSQVIGL